MKKKIVLSVLSFLLLAITCLFIGNEYSYAQKQDEIDGDPGYWKAHGYYHDAYEYTYKDEGDNGLNKFAIRNEDCDVRLGVDVSKYQGEIDWQKAKEQGIEFAIIRVGYRTYTEGNLYDDPYYVQNIEGALEAGIPVGVYMFSQAITEKEAIQEANYILKRICDYKITLPVIMDYEYAGDSETGRLRIADLTNEEATDICKAFLKTVKAAGYTPMLYANKYMLSSKLNASEIEKDYRIWLAHYTEETDYAGIYDFWQYSDKGDGKYYGMSSTYLDMNYWYDDGSIRGRVYRIKYELNGGKNSSKNPLTYRNSEVILNDPTRKGYVFRGWYTDENFKNQITTIKKGTKKDYTLYAKWEVEVKPTEVQLNKTTAWVRKGKTLTLKAKVFPDNVSYEGVTWSSSDENIATIDATGKITALEHGTTTITAAAIGDKNITATCEVTVPYVIKYKLDGGTNHKENPSTYYQQEVTLKKPSKTGYIFKGWYTDKEFKNKITSISIDENANYTLYAKWSAIKYNIKFSGNEATTGSMGSIKNISYDEAYTLPANAFKRTGYSFKGWNTEADGTGTTYKNKTSVINLATKNKKTVTLYAQWRKTKYTITYKLNGGKNDSKNPGYYYVTTDTIKLQKPTRKGYTFKGWYSDDKFKNKVTQIEKGSTENKTLYAKWQKVSVGNAALSSAKNISSKKLVVKYKKVSGAKGYQIVYSTDKNFKKNVEKITTKDLSYTIKSLKKGKNYYVKVRAYKLDSTGRKVYGKYSTIKQVKIKK